MSGIRIIISRKKIESVGADVNLTWDPYVSIVTGWSSAITLGAGTRDGQVKKITNTSGSQITIDVDINVQGADTDQILIENGGYIKLLYLNNEDVTERYRDIDGSNYTLN